MPLKKASDAWPYSESARGISNKAAIRGGDMRKQLSVCPSADCRAANPQQELIGTIEAGQINDRRVQPGSYRCSYCGCVWVYHEHPNKRILGHWDSSLAGMGWKPHA